MLFKMLRELHGPPEVRREFIGGVIREARRIAYNDTLQFIGFPTARPPGQGNQVQGAHFKSFYENFSYSCIKINFTTGLS